MWKPTVLLTGALLGLASLALAQEAEDEGALVSRQVAGALALDPTAETWQAAVPVTVVLDGQGVTTPMLMAPSVTQVTVRSVHNGSEIAFLLSWQDASEDRFQTTGRFSDAVAIQVPYRPSEDVPVTMGDKGERVLILHWAAFRQENIDNGYADTAKLYPNYAFDWYPHALAPYRYPEDWHNQYALNYIGGEKVLRKNAVKSPVREVVAEGFGSSTWKDVQRAEGRGTYKDGVWHVVIKRRFVEENTSNPDWGPGTSTFVTFAAWDGNHGERGARKSLGYVWTSLTIEGP